MDLKKAVQVLWGCVAVTLVFLVLFLRFENDLLLFLLLGRPITIIPTPYSRLA